MNVVLATKEITILSRVYTFYTPGLNEERFLNEKARKLLHDRLQRIGILDHHDPETLHTLVLTPDEWQELRRALASNANSWKPYYSAVGFPTEYPSLYEELCTLLQKLESLSLAAQVEEALESETTS